ncbi:4Fe-4S dicluster domain-containing protein [Thermodesulfobacteriota bacterium]
MSDEQTEKDLPSEDEPTETENDVQPGDEPAVEQLRSGDKLTEMDLRSPFKSEISEASEQHMADCYQCGKCSAGCPMVDYMDLMPNAVMRNVQMGLRERVLGCKTIWMCASCETCTTRCPQEIDIARIMDTLREISLRSNMASPEMRDITCFHELFLGSVRKNGRLDEARIVMNYKIWRPRHLFEDMVTGLQMVLKGKMPFLPHKIKRRSEVEQIFKKCSG